MSFVNFEQRIRRRFNKFETAEFETTEDGKHIASFPRSGVRITGTILSNAITVQWGSGHIAMAQL